MYLQDGPEKELIFCTYLGLGEWLAATTFVTYWNRQLLAISYLAGCDFLTASVSTPANSIGHSSLRLWCPEAPVGYTKVMVRRRTLSSYCTTWIIYTEYVSF